MSERMSIFSVLDSWHWKAKVGHNPCCPWARGLGQELTIPTASTGNSEQVSMAAHEARKSLTVVWEPGRKGTPVGKTRAGV